MALTHALVSLNSSTAVLLNSDATVTNGVETRYTWQYGTISIQNVDASATVYIGGSTVSSTSYGISLAAGSSVTLDSLGPEELVYAISTGSSKVGILMVTTA
jgi:hypothetical protein